MRDEQKTIAKPPQNLENTTALKEFCDSTSSEMTGSQGTKTQKMSLRASFSRKTYWSWITQKRAGKGQEEYDNFCSHMLKLNQVTQEETVPGVLTFSQKQVCIQKRVVQQLFCINVHDTKLLKSQDTVAANSLSCLFIIEETHSSKFCVGFTMTR